MLSTNPKAQNSGCHYLPQSTEGKTPCSPNQELLPLSARVNHRDCLEIGGCDVTDLVEQFGSPLYILDEQGVREASRQYRDAFAHYYPGESLVIYASKAWSNLAVSSLVASEGLGVDVASGGELYTALQAGVSAEKIYLHGNNKSSAELRQARSSGCTIVVDNWLELRTLAELAQGEHERAEEQRGRGAEGKQADQSLCWAPPHLRTSTPLSNNEPVRIMLRLTPGIECHTHEYIRTGHLDSKFGFDPNQVNEVFAFISQQPHLDCTGVHAHIGSQIFELQPHQDLAGVLVEWLSKAAEYGLSIRELNVGGGLGIRYTEVDDPPRIDEWVKTVCEAVVDACQSYQLPLPKLIAEPGRSLLGPAGVTAYTVGSRKVVPGIRTYVAVDGGMSDNARPITYESVYRAVVANRMSVPANETVTIAGKHCESGDILIKDAQLPETEAGDVLVMSETGAYGYSMASNYNRLPRPAAVLVNQGEPHLIVQRETYQDLIRQDRLPERLVIK
ncbi:MAG: diaminopimelate decarboxylase [Cyanobacteria bacterium QH_9_48_43]|jgi:diaminopimelate decarboxylase|nr:MAG: diaminopimelate decarboxylase [Cyanobacteria bacterium QH_10_48_56]PSO69722.1 MAG: diaminopimelate decarboxylase [Cyanobacteria bacterium QS_1_48_34]PSO88484.1 MAG: diaminopimelate decarboxylase [Cyanobacteria bacterium QH_9_48_43]PSO92608.1 MAG: diaminopimelate decarboxylase [Cyanobacteria bacterium QS_6_48_18]PSP24023.1 MAG: diaminopimelate decarboxylase [Cyanobacteria bacterium SW_5_48_44]PSP31073.1 MAG: diaminopimelate decarboxylase [Cyanobacteria bacterium SW_4_48_29]